MVLVGKLRESGHLKDLVIDGRLTAKWIIKKWDGEAWTTLISLRTWTVVRRL